MKEPDGRIQTTPLQSSTEFNFDYRRPEYGPLDTFPKKKKVWQATNQLVLFGELQHANEMVQKENFWRYLAHVCKFLEGNAKFT